MSTAATGEGPSSAPPEKDSTADCIVRVYNIPSQIDEDSLKQVMGHFGRVRRCRVILGQGTMSSCEAFVLYKQSKEAAAAVKADEKLECGGCTLKISLWDGEFPSDASSNKRTLADGSNDACWFCLSNIACEDHMVSYVSDQSYIAIAKGPIDPLHSLVTPIYHYPSAASASKTVLEDMQRLVDCLFDLCLKNGMGAVAFERYMPMHNPTAMHTQIQVVPVPLDRAMEAFEYVSGSEHFAGSRVEPLGPEHQTSLVSLEKRLDGLGRSYFYLQAVGRNTNGRGGLVHSHCLWTLGHRGGGRRIPITFGRELILHLLPDSAVSKMPCYSKRTGFNGDSGATEPGHDDVGTSTGTSWKNKALDWRNCVTNKEYETSLAQELARAIITSAK
ncbi:RNA recognition motif domain containing protein [Babesia ovis]|uniref:RNA recognition motif domain containing protein n=1 Tax=Babesia ovis TaxID=5869 RepID=A0A9W5WUJ9_BABOV|nr:RNA recognition motif domain containing protein [Babesia ovis]